MIEKETLLRCESATMEAGRELSETLHAGQVLGITGNLGAGKTHLVKGIVAGLGSAADVSSPTFSLVQEYTDGRLPVYHFDFYRLKDAQEVLDIGWDEYLDRNGVVMVEWAEQFRELMPDDTRWLILEHDQESGGRRLKVLS